MGELLLRKVEDKDLNDINSLLHQVLQIHANGRPDIFKSGTKKYTDEELLNIFKDPQTPVFVAEDEGKVVGYCFCIYQISKETENMYGMKTLYIDDLCVDQNCRGKHVGQRLYEYVLDFARHEGFYNVTLNVWACNESALKFYEKMGLVPLKTMMEKIL